MGMGKAKKGRQRDRRAKTKLNELVLQYTGRNCNCSTNEGGCSEQGDKLFIDGPDPSGQAATTITTPFGSMADVQVGDAITLKGSFSAWTEIRVAFVDAATGAAAESVITFHTSCSVPCRYGDGSGITFD